MHFPGEAGMLACRDCGDRPRVADTEPMLISERRRYERFDVPQPLRTSVGTSPAYVVDASISGIGVLHHQPAPHVGTACRLMFYSEFGPITLECEIVRSGPDRAERVTSGDNAMHTGLRIIAADDASEARLRSMIFSLSRPVNEGPNSH